MGATITLDLTTDVTHLIVGIINTPKYRFVAVNRPDVRCLLPECIEAVAASWMEGGDTDVEALEKKYRLPIFHGLKICVTNLDDRMSRGQIRNRNEMLTTNNSCAAKKVRGARQC